MISPDFFVLPGGEHNFKTLAYTPKDDPTQSRVIIAKAVDHIAQGLFCMFQSLGVPPPVVRLRENNMLEQKICKKLAELFENAAAQSQSGSQPAKFNNPSKRCILVLLDRYDDL